MNQLATVRTLQQRIAGMQPLRLDERALPTARGLAPLLPEGVLRKGSSYAVQGSRSLAFAFLAEASTSGLWCAVIGCSTFGAEAASGLGIALDRCIVAPDPGDHALGLTGLLSEAFSIVVLHLPGGRGSRGVGPGDAARLSARLREHGCALVVIGEWPRAEGSLRVTGSRWSGLGQGGGILETRELVVRSQDRRGIRRHTVRFDRGAICDGGSGVDSASTAGRTPPSTPLHGREPVAL
ncbi:hypothetical protein ACFPZL_10245 [Leucobacter soli]|uniref:Uncharacterized protein n=1 Tax=Leucobacter soli TaxID=2812850 RepID=A0A916JT80_9MICO|nr:hypothetical protein [Leucobacter soli]CAG7601499.1 hypothetical protein LEUCIP111803_00471 [Leucobacter soli]